MQLQFSISGNEEVNTLLIESKEYLENDTNFMELRRGIVQIIRNDVTARFMTAPIIPNGGFVLGGEYWEPVTEAYLRQRPERIGGTLLVDTEKMKNSIIQEGAEGQEIEYTEEGFIIKSNVVYANRQNWNRPYIFFYEDLTNRIIEYIYGYILDH